MIAWIDAGRHFLHRNINKKMSSMGNRGFLESTPLPFWTVLVGLQVLNNL